MKTIFVNKCTSCPIRIHCDVSEPPIVKPPDNCPLPTIEKRVTIQKIITERYRTDYHNLCSDFAKNKKELNEVSREYKKASERESKHIDKINEYKRLVTELKRNPKDESTVDAQRLVIERDRKTLEKLRYSISEKDNYIKKLEEINAIQQSLADELLDKETELEILREENSNMIKMKKEIITLRTRVKRYEDEAYAKSK